MGNKVTVIKNGVTEVFENVLGHQVGFSHLQVMERSGNQRIINDFDDITIELDEQAAANFAEELFNMENPPQNTEVVEVEGENGPELVEVEAAH